MGIEFKPQNLFYDYNSGFTIIDLLYSSTREFNYSSIEDISFLNNLVSSFAQFSCVYSYKGASEEEEKMSKEICNALKFKLFNIMKKVIPDFYRYERWLFRTMNNDVIDSFCKLDNKRYELTLTDEEEKEFYIKVDQIIEECKSLFISGKYTLWQITYNEISRRLQSNTLYSAFMYMSNNGIINEDKSSFEYKMSCERELINICLEKFYNSLKESVNDNTSELILNTIEELESKNGFKK